MIEIFDDVEQGSDEWRGLRLGLPTALNFSYIMAEGKDGEAAKTRKKYLYHLACERLRGIPGTDYKNKYMERGNEMEPKAREFYAFTRDVEVRQVGFIKNTLPGTSVVVGCSPDGLIGKKKALEIKTLEPELLAAQYDRGHFMPTEHRAQVQGTMLVAELDEVDLMLFCDAMPRPVIFTVERDEVYLKELSNAIEVFDHELRRWVQKHGHS